MRAPIRVLVVDDSALTRQMLTRALGVDPAIEIVGTAKDGLEAIELARALEPDVITLDIEMPALTGLEALPRIISSTPARVVMLSGIDDPDTTYQALSLGATDFIVKPRAGIATSLSSLSEVVIKKIKTAYRVRPDHRIAADVPPYRPAESRETPQEREDGLRLVVLAASTGGPPALETVFAALDPALPAAYVVVQHLPAGFSESLARRIQRVTDIGVVQAIDGIPVRQGVAYIAPHGSHIRVSGRTGTFIRLETGSPVHGVMPAADPLFESAAEHFTDRSIGVVLTGMGSDGARGLKAIRDAGGESIAQDELTSVVWGMPGAAVRLGAASRVVPLRHIAREVASVVRGGVSV